MEDAHLSHGIISNCLHDNMPAHSLESVVSVDRKMFSKEAVLHSQYGRRHSASRLIIEFKMNRKHKWRLGGPAGQRQGPWLSPLELAFSGDLSA